MKRNLRTVADFAKDGPFTENQLRWMIFQAERNGLAGTGALIRLSRRVYIDVDAFDRWLDAHAQKAAA